MSLDGLGANGPAAGPESAACGARELGLADAFVHRRGEIARPATGAGAPADVAVHRIWLGGGRDAASGARAAVDLLTFEHFDEIAREHVRLMVSELVANSVVHGGAGGADDSIELLVTIQNSSVRVECTDPLGGFDVPETALDTSGANGYGLSIIDALSARWGTRLGSDGSTWFEFES
jgi:hypothetical protein